VLHQQLLLVVTVVHVLVGLLVLPEAQGEALTTVELLLVPLAIRVVLLVLAVVHATRLLLRAVVQPALEAQVAVEVAQPLQVALLAQVEPVVVVMLL
jgi:hypothetical protein